MFLHLIHLLNVLSLAMTIQIAFKAGVTKSQQKNVDGIAKALELYKTNDCDGVVGFGGGGCAAEERFHDDGQHVLRPRHRRLRQRPQSARSSHFTGHVRSTWSSSSEASAANK